MIKKIKEIMIEKEIETLLYPDKEITFERLLDMLTEKKVCSSRKTLAKYLTQLKKKKIISSRANPKSRRETLYRLNPLFFDRSSLFPSLVAASCFWEFMESNNEILKNSINKDEPDDHKIITHVIGEIEKNIGKIFLNILALPAERGIDRIEVLHKFTMFMSLYLIMKDRFIMNEINKTDYFKDLEKAVSAPYSAWEDEIVNAMKLNIEYNKQGRETTKAFLNEFYKELGFPFDLMYEK